MRSETIAAIATPPGNGGIGIIRVSGGEAVAIVDKLYCNKKNEHVLMQYASHTIHYGLIMDGDETVDEVMVSVMKAPHSYTTEDTVEINCHGGMTVLSRILELVIAHGARTAEPGEFTKRAFLGGRIDLAQAEAVMDTIQAKNELALKASVSQIRGSVSEKIGQMRAQILHEIAFIESALDDPEHISLDGYPQELTEKTDDLIAQCECLIRSFDNGKVIKEGIRTVIVGKPNAGKSSLLNLLLGEEKAIVTDIAGTTRDTLEESLMIGDIRLNIADTAGIRDTGDIIEQIGVQRAKTYAANADLILYVVDSSVPLDENDEEIMRSIQGKKVIVLLNKSDLPAVIAENDFAQTLLGTSGETYAVIRTSTVMNISAAADTEAAMHTLAISDTETGVRKLEQTIRGMFFSGEIQENAEVIITNIRHKEALSEALQSLRKVKESLTLAMPEDFYSIDLMGAYASLGRIIGEEVEDDLVNEIFAKFCMGK